MAQIMSSNLRFLPKPVGLKDPRQRLNRSYRSVHMFSKTKIAVTKTYVSAGNSVIGITEVKKKSLLKPSVLEKQENVPRRRCGYEFSRILHFKAAIKQKKSSPGIILAKASQPAVINQAELCYGQNAASRGYEKPQHNSNTESRSRLNGAKAL